MRKYTFIPIRCCFMSLVFTLTACQSDESKMAMLKGDRATACLLAQKYEREYGFVSNQPYSPKRDSLMREYSDWSTKCELATRELNRFMH